MTPARSCLTKAPFYLPLSVRLSPPGPSAIACVCASARANAIFADGGREGRDDGAGEREVQVQRTHPRLNCMPRCAAIPAKCQLRGLPSRAFNPKTQLPRSGAGRPAGFPIVSIRKTTHTNKKNVEFLRNQKGAAER